MYRGYIRLGSVEIVNTTRAVAYLHGARCSNTLTVVNDDSWKDFYLLAQQEPYTSPVSDPAPWFDDQIPESSDFLGVWGLNVTGLDSAPLNRKTIDGASEGGAFGAVAYTTRAITVEALLFGATPRGLSWGIEWLNAALMYDRCGAVGIERDLEFLDYAPHAPYVPEVTSREQVQALATEAGRKVFNVVCTKSIEVVSKFGNWHLDESQKIAAKVSFTLTAANPFVWKHERALFKSQKLSTGEVKTVKFENVDDSGNCPAICDTSKNLIFDPNMSKPIALPRPITPASAVGCQSFESKTIKIVTSVDSLRPWEIMLPNVVIQAGAKDERSIRVQWYRGAYGDSEPKACDSIAEALIGYIPAGGFLTLDGISGLATIKHKDDANSLDATSLVTGRGGQPWRAPLLMCGDVFTCVVQASKDVDEGCLVAATGAVRVN